MKTLFSPKAYMILIITIVFILQDSCGQGNMSGMELKRYLNYSFFNKIITDKYFKDSICGISNFTDKPYTNDSIGINRFIASLLCESGHMSIQDEYEAYFGTGIISNLDLIASYIGVGQLDTMDERKKPLYINTALQFFNSHIKELNNNPHIHPFGGYTALFYAIINDIRKNKYDNLKQYIPGLIRIYKYTVNYNHLMSDMVLDVIRGSKDPEAIEFLKGKYFLSDDFNSNEFIHVYDSIGDKDYTNYIKKGN